MPTLKRRMPSRRETESTLTGAQVSHLLCGFAFLGPMDPFRDDEQRRECWKKHRSYLIHGAHGYEGGAVPGLDSLVAAPEKGRLPKAFYDYEVRRKPASGRVCKHYVEQWGKE